MTNCDFDIGPIYELCKLLIPIISLLSESHTYGIKYPDNFVNTIRNMMIDNDGIIVPIEITLYILKKNWRLILNCLVKDYYILSSWNYLD